MDFALYLSLAAALSGTAAAASAIGVMRIFHMCSFGTHTTAALSVLSTGTHECELGLPFRLALRPDCTLSQEGLNLTRGLHTPPRLIFMTRAPKSSPPEWFPQNWAI